MVHRAEKTKNYTVMMNYHLFDKRLSLKARGLLAQMLALPDNWNYTAKGLAAINKESYHTIRGIIGELEDNGYIIRRQKRTKAGEWNQMEYDIYEIPHFTPEEMEPDTPEPDPGTPPPVPHQAEADAPELDADTLNRYRWTIRENIDYDLLWTKYGADIDILNGYVEMMAEVCAGQTPIKVNGFEVSPDEAERRFLSLNMNHILYVMECMRDRTREIRNVRAYTLAALFNAPNTIDQHYESMVGRTI